MDATKLRTRIRLLHAPTDLAGKDRLSVYNALFTLGKYDDPAYIAFEADQRAAGNVVDVAEARKIANAKRRERDDLKRAKLRLLEEEEAAESERQFAEVCANIAKRFPNAL
jgi:hypothetical protein